MGRTEFSDLKVITSEPGLANAKSSTSAKWRSSLNAWRNVVETILDTADIVRDA